VAFMKSRTASYFSLPRNNEEIFTIIGQQTTNCSGAVN